MQRKLDGLLEPIASGLRSPTLQPKLDNLEQRKAALELQQVAGLSSAPYRHPNLAELYRQKVAVT